MKRYFRLNPFCRLIHNGEKGCLYDLTSGKMWDIEENNLDILTRAEKNFSVEKCEFLDSLSELNLGSYYESPVWIDKSGFGVDKISNSVLNKRPVLNCLYIVFNECSLDCEFCSSDLNRQTGCKKHCVPDIISKEEVLNTVESASSIGCTEIHYIGGDPLVYGNRLKQLLHDLSPIVEKQTIYTNGSLIDQMWIDVFKEYDVGINYQFNGESDNSYITQCKAVLEMLYNNGIKTHINLLIHKDTVSSDIKELINLALEHNWSYSLDTVIEPVEYTAESSQKIIGKGMRFSVDINPCSFSVFLNQNSCLFGKIAILLNGDILPCPMMDKYIVGNIRDASIIDILQTEAYQEVVFLTKEKQEKCNECVYRFGCRDCRAIEFNLTGNTKSNQLCTLK